MKTDAQKRANKKYDETHTVQIKLKLNKKTDHDIIQKKEKQNCQRRFFDNYKRITINENSNNAIDI